jgi:hypothetical protein
MKKCVRVVLAVVLLAAPGFASSIDFTYNDLLFPGSIATTVYGVNNNGTVAGDYSNAPGKTFGFTGNPSTSLSTLNLTSPSNSPCTPVNTVPTGINGSGAVVGAVTGCGATKGSFLTTTSGGSFTDFNPPSSLAPSGYTFSGGQATDINNSNELVGYFAGIKGSSFFFDGYETTNESTFTTIIDPNAGPTSATLPAAINNNGDVVGLYIDSTSGNSVGFLFENGQYYDVNAANYTNNLAVFTDASGIDAAGDIVGFYKDSSGLSYGFILSGYTLGVGTVSGGTFTTLLDPNCLDGPSTSCNNGGNNEGTQVLGISPNGQEITGKYVDSSGTTGFYANQNLATVPEPASILLMVTGLAALGFYWRKRTGRTA